MEISITDNEYAVLWGIANKTGMQDWFYLNYDSVKQVFIFQDLENKDNTDWKQAIFDVISCDLSVLDHLTLPEIAVCVNLLQRLADPSTPELNKKLWAEADFLGKYYEAETARIAKEKH